MAYVRRHTRAVLEARGLMQLDAPLVCALLKVPRAARARCPGAP